MNKYGIIADSIWTIRLKNNNATYLKTKIDRELNKGVNNMLKEINNKLLDLDVRNLKELL